MSDKNKYGTHKKADLKNFSISFFVFLACILIVNILATQYIANVFSYHQNLGEPIFENFYNPFSWIFWSIEYFNDYSKVFQKVYFGVSFALIGVLIIFFFIRLFAARSAMKHDDIHGTAKWADFDELKNSSFYNRKNGVYIGGYQDDKNRIHYLRHNGPEHILAFAPTRSGKGVGLVIPTLLAWEDSAFILDIKGENWAISSQWRKQYANNKVLKFDPTSISSDTVRFNPLEEIRINTEYEVGDAQNLASMIVDSEGKGLASYWDKAAFTFIAAFILHVIYKNFNENKKPANLNTLYTFLNNPDLDIEDLINEMMTYPHIKEENQVHPTIASAAKEAANKVSEELSGVIGTVTSNLGLYADPLIARNIEKSDFKINDLMNGETPVSLYFVIDPDDLERLTPLNRIIVNQVIKKSMRKMVFENGKQVKNYKYRLLFLGDEFTSLGKLDIFQKSLAFMAAYGIKSYIIIQDLSQLYLAYTKDEAITSNCQVRIAFTPYKLDTAKAISEMAGTTTVVKSYTTTSGSRIAVMLSQVTESYQEVSRPLFTPGEVMTMPKAIYDNEDNIIGPGDMLIFTGSTNPIYGKQILFFQDKTFLTRSSLGAAKESDKLTPSFSKEEKLKNIYDFKIKVEDEE